jgi:hypothetical protein
MTRTISRRTVLRGLGTAISLPLLEAMIPGSSSAAVDPKTSVKRMAFIYVPNGANMADWTPARVGANYELPYILEPLKPFKDQMLVLSGLTCDKARPHGDGAGDHAREVAFLTCAQPKKSANDIKVGISVDQLAAQKIGTKTKFPSLELGIERGQQAGNCDSGYSCAYQANMSWRSETTPQSKEIDPKQVFERLFAGLNQPKAEVAMNKDAREIFNKSILDFVQEDASSLRNALGSGDQRKLDEYLSAVREIEQRLERTMKANVEAKSTTPAFDTSKLVKPTGIPKDYEEHVKLMCDMLVLAFQTDQTRIITLPFANGGSNRSYKSIGVAEGHHDLSHHGKSKEKQDKIKQINRYHVTLLAYLLEKLKGVKEGGGTLLDNCMMVYGSAICDGDRHNHEDLPIILLGKGGGTIRGSGHVRYTMKDLPLANLYVTMLDRMGSSVARFGDSTGKLQLP